MGHFSLGYWGHRGSQTDDPVLGRVSPHYRRPEHPAENTLPAFRAALDDGADGLEIDVMMSCDGALVVTHSNDLSQHVFTVQQQGESREGYVRGRTLNDLRALPVGVHRNGTIPTLSEVFDLLHTYSAQHPDRKLTLNIEMKDVKGTFDPPDRDAMVEALAHAIRASGWPPERVVVSSFAREDLVAMAAQKTGVGLGMLFTSPEEAGQPIYKGRETKETYLGFTPQTINETCQMVEGLTALHPELGSITGETMRAAASEGLAVNPWFDHERHPSEDRERLRDKVQLAKAAGVNEMHLITNFPAAMRGLKLQPAALAHGKEGANSPAR
jgi:glycerophosphoryl diester phosphodiesterase